MFDTKEFLQAEHFMGNVAIDWGFPSLSLA